MPLTPTDIKRIAAAVAEVSKPVKEDKALDLVQASEYARMSVSWLQKRLYRGEIPYFRLGARCIRIMKSDLDSYIDRQRQISYRTK